MGFAFGWALQSRFSLNPHGLVIILKPMFNNFYWWVMRVILRFDIDIDELWDINAFERTKAFDEWLVAFVKGGTRDPEWFNSLDIFKAEAEATLSGIVAAQWLIPVEKVSLPFFLSLRK